MEKVLQSTGLSEEELENLWNFTCSVNSVASKIRDSNVSLGDLLEIDPKLIELIIATTAHAETVRQGVYDRGIDRLILNKKLLLGKQLDDIDLKTMAINGEVVSIEEKPDSCIVVSQYEFGGKSYSVEWQGSFISSTSFKDTIVVRKYYVSDVTFRTL